MKSKIFSVTILALMFVAINAQSQFNVFERINRLSLNSEIMLPDENGNFEYDAYLFCMRKVINGKQLTGQSYDDVKYRIFAEAVFLKDKKYPQSVGRVTCGNLTLSQNPYGIYYMEPDTFIAPALSPNINWTVHGSQITPDFEEDLSHTLKFPEFYYISSYGNRISLNSDEPWTMTSHKWKEDAGFTLERPDLLFTWILGPTNNPNDNLRNLQACGRFRDVTQDQLESGVEGKWIRSVFEGARIILGEGCAVIRTVKLYPQRVVNNSMDQNWLFVMIVETEVPVTFR